MSPGAHLLTSWILANQFEPNQRGRRLIAIAGVIPDIDGVGLVADVLTHDRTEYYATYHHLLAHNLLFGLVVSGVAVLLVKTNKVRVFLLSLIAFHLHLVFDLMGSGGADGFRWPIHYLYPFAPNLELSWSGQWVLNGWQNLSILAVLFVWAISVSVNLRRSFLEVISAKLDQQVFHAINKRWPA
jgi:inner membrane protein